MSLSPSLVALHDQLATLFGKRINPEAGHAAYAAAAVELLEAKGWHLADDCPECPAEHCEEPEDHGPYGNAQLVEAVQMLHAQAHSAAGDTVYADRCTREPCVTVGGGNVPSSDARGLFAPGSRVVA